MSHFYHVQGSLSLLENRPDRPASGRPLRPSVIRRVVYRPLPGLVDDRPAVVVPRHARVARPRRMLVVRMIVMSVVVPMDVSAPVLVVMVAPGAGAILFDPPRGNDLLVVVVFCVGFAAETHLGGSCVLENSRQIAMSEKDEFVWLKQSSRSQPTVGDVGVYRYAGSGCADKNV